MEKKGEIFNQLAIISDLLENINLESESKSVIFVVNEKEFNLMFNKITKRVKSYMANEIENTFSVKIGEIDFIFNMNNV
jgi:hypothetical protein